MNLKLEVPEDNVPPENVSKRIVIVQLNRLGDLIQTCTVVRDLRTAAPNIRVDLVAREIFARPLKFLLSEVFDQVHTVDTTGFLESKQTLDDCYHDLRKTIEKINTEPTNVLINFSFSKTSAALTSMIRADHRFGAWMDEKWNLLIQDRWSQYIYSNLMGGSLNALHLNDLLRMILGLKEPITTNKTPRADSNRLFINPFASHSKKMWRIEKWIEIIYKTLKTDSEVEIHLLGGKQDQQSAQKVLDNQLLRPFQTRIVSHVGSADLKKVTQLLQDAKLFVGHDSMNVQLASYLGIPTITVALGTVRPHETSPEGPEHLVIAPKTKCFPCFPDTSCSNFKCHADISYQVLSSAITSFIRSGHHSYEELTKTVTEFHLASSNLYLSERNSTSGLTELVLLNREDTDVQAVMRSFYRLAWLYLLEEKDELIQEPQLTLERTSQLDGIRVNLQNVFDLCQFGQNYSRYILEEIASATPDLVKIKQYGQKIDEIDQLMNALTQQTQELYPITNYLKVKKANLTGDQIISLTEQTFFIYNEGVLLCKMIYELIEQTLKKNSKREPQKTLDV